MCIRLKVIKVTLGDFEIWHHKCIGKNLISLSLSKIEIINYRLLYVHTSTHFTGFDLFAFNAKTVGYHIKYGDYVSFTIHIFDIQNRIISHY